MLKKPADWSSPSTPSSSPSSISRVNKPRVGGVSSDGVAWVGGEPINQRKTPKNPYCYRPTSWKESMKVADACCGGIKEVLEIGEGAKTSVVTFLNRWDAHLTKTGMDTVFYLKDENNIERYLVMEYAHFTMPQVKSQVKEI